MTYTMNLNGDGVDGIFGEADNVSVVVGGDAEVTGIYTFTGEGQFTATDSDGNVVVVETENLPE